MRKLGSRAFWPNTNNIFVTQFNDVLFNSAGNHGLKAGVEYKHTNVFRNAARYARGQMAFNREFTADPQNRAATGDGFAEFMLGWAAGGNLGNENGENLMANSFAAFVQDDWKVSPRLTRQPRRSLRYFLCADVPGRPRFQFPAGLQPDRRQRPPAADSSQERQRLRLRAESAGFRAAPGPGLPARRIRPWLRAGFGIIYAQDDSFSSPVRAMDEPIAGLRRVQPGHRRPHQSAGDSARTASRRCSCRRPRSRVRPRSASTSRPPICPISIPSSGSSICSANCRMTF